MAKILVVEDDENLRFIYSKNLIKKNYIVESVDNGMDALEKVGEFGPDIILLDIMLPDLNGLELLQLLKDQPKYRNIPVLMITGISDPNEIKKCLDIGAMGFILKGSSSEEMEDKIEIILRTLNI
ncbi:MAG: response regulator [Candidatus Dadabacteria bacterium]|nr:response regulator [Candidatus Dadabacteria bacterium]NIQ14977.1 response regulator [Candidatus Dadabacteria bacterium]